VFDKALYTLLTPVQQEKYVGYRAYLRLVGRYKPAELSEDQKAKVQALCEQNAKAYLAAKDDDAARKDLDKKVDEQVRKDILTKDQLDKMEEARKKQEEKRAATTKPASEPAANPAAVPAAPDVKGVVNP